MTKEELNDFRLSLMGLTADDLYALRKSLDRQIRDRYYEDSNFKNREKADSYIYAVIYPDLHCHYDYLGKRAYEEYVNGDAVRIEAKTKSLFPEWNLLMAKGDLAYGQN